MGEDVTAAGNDDRAPACGRGTVQVRHLEGGAKGQTRTADRTIFSRELYQLSYLGGVEESEARRWVGDRGLEPLTSTV